MTILTTAEHISVSSIFQISTERRGAVGHGLSAIWGHHAGPALVALVTRPSALKLAKLAH